MKKIDIIEKANISSNVLAQMRKYQSVSMETLENIRTTTDCNIGEIVKIVKNDVEEV